MVANSSLPLAAYERGEKTRAEMAAELGVSERHLRRLLAEDRERVADGTDRDDIDELPYLALTCDPSRESGDYYDLDTDRLSRDSGRVRIGDHNGRRLLVRSVNGGAPVEQAKPKKGPAKFRPKRPRGRKKRAMIDT